MYPSRLYDILMYGGALLIILGIICISSIIVLSIRWHRMITSGTRTIQYIGSGMLVPLLSLVGLFRDIIKKPTKSKNDM